ncbi:MAG: hypothetical protein HKN39_02470 [Flavobacteriales bacterium]|nr:hypothetical protein [Flavobacteriales bacterium]
MKNTRNSFTNDQVTAYLNFHYAPGYLQDTEEYYYNGIKDAYLSIPYQKTQFSNHELIEIFKAPGTEFSSEVELARIILFINQNSKC